MSSPVSLYINKFIYEIWHVVLGKNLQSCQHISCYLLTLFEEMVRSEENDEKVKNQRNVDHLSL